MLLTLGWKDLTTRSGLKKVHARFPEIFKKLDTVYVSAQRRGNVRMMGGIVGVWAKMCADAILRDKLFQEGEQLSAESVVSMGYIAPHKLHRPSLESHASA